MAFSYAALCSDHYVNQRLSLKMDLSLKRDTVLGLFDRLKREHPSLDRLRRLQSELALETAGEQTDALQQWVAIRRTSIRSGVANPRSANEARSLHRSLLETAPYYLDVTALDVDHVELLYGFDLQAAGNHDAIVCRALMSGSAVASILDRPGAVPVDCQPLIGLCLNDAPDHQAFLEVKTRSTGAFGAAIGGSGGVGGMRRRPLGGDADGAMGAGDDTDSPISVYLIVRRVGPVREIKELPGITDELSEQAAELVEQVIVPNVLAPLRACIVTG